MREFNFRLDDDIFKGLRRFPNSQRRSSGLVECHNLAPAEAGIELHEYVTSMNESADFGGLGVESASSITRDITINVRDFVRDDSLVNVTVFIDGDNKGTTDSLGLITLSNVTVGSHSIKMTRTNYTDSDADTLINDFIMVI